MKDIFLFSFNSIMPIILLVVLGYVIKKLGFGSAEFYKTANSMVFKLFLPVMLFYNVYEIKSLGDINWQLILYFCVAILIITGLGFLCSKLITKDRTKIPVITQCAFRSNHAIIGLPLAESIGGQPAVAFASVISAVAIPLYNILAVIILSYYSTKDSKGRLKATVIRTIKNPLIIGCFIGIVVLVIRQFIPVDEAGNYVFTLEKNVPFLMKAISNLSKVCSPLALVILGARFDFSAVKNLFKEISFSVILRLIIAPLIGLGGVYLLSKYTSFISVTAADYPGLIALFGSPVAVSSAVMVGEIGGDDQLATQLVVWTSVLSMFTVFATVFILKSASLI